MAGSVGVKGEGVHGTGRAHTFVGNGAGEHQKWQESLWVKASRNQPCKYLLAKGSQ